MNFRIITVKKRSPILFTVCLKSFLPIRSLRAFPVKRNCFMDFCLTVKKVGNLLAELDSRKGIGLITRIRQGLGRPDRIYVRKCTQQDMYKRNIQTRQNDISGNAKMTGTDMSEMPGNDTEDNKTEISDTDRSDTEYLSFYSEESEEMHRKRMEREVYHQMILTNIGYEYLVDVYNRDMLNEIVELIVDTVCSE